MSADGQDDQFEETPSGAPSFDPQSDQMTGTPDGGLQADIYAQPMRAYGGLPAKWKRRQRLCVFLFFATCFSTFFVGSDFFSAALSPKVRNEIRAAGRFEYTHTTDIGTFDVDLNLRLMRMTIEGLKYSGPLMLILLFHEMGHYIQARRYGVPATFPFFIPMPIPPLGTMGAVIVQGAGVANRKAMFDIAVSGPLAGLFIALPALYYGVTQASYMEIDFSKGWVEFGDPLILQYMIQSVHGPQPEGMVLVNSSVLFAGWVGVLITALNLIPVGQLDGGHILYTLIGKKAHFVAYAVLGIGFAYMVYIQYPAYLLLFILMIVMGPKHPPTTDDAMPLGWARHVIGWATLSFIIIGFTLRPIVVHEQESAEPAEDSIGTIDHLPLDASTRLLRHMHSV